VFTATPTIPVGNGGTGATSLTQGQVLFGTGTTAISSSSTFFWDSVNLRLGIGTAPPSYPHYHCRPEHRVLRISERQWHNRHGRPRLRPRDLEKTENHRVSLHRCGGNGAQEKKGVIAQEVEQVYPDAVYAVSDFIPSMHAMADDVHCSAASHELTITVPKAHGFAADDLVRIIADAGSAEKSVAAVLGERTFVLSGVEQAPHQVFVFGKKVADFRVVDYNQLLSINIGATQQLAIENQTLKKENAALQAENKLIEARLAALERAIADLRKQK
jgi:hypothetical protein